MSTPNERPTPETDAATWETATREEVTYASFAAKLERERDEAREALSGRTVSCSQCNEVARQLEAMREEIETLGKRDEWKLQQIQVLHEGLHKAKHKIEAMRSAIKEAAGALSYSARMLSRKEHDVEFVTAALAKLQPYLKP